MRMLSLLTVLAAFTASPRAEARPPSTVTLSIIGTSDLHGHIAALPWFAGYLANLRAARLRDGGAVVVVDAGDMFQGTLESNLGEGAAVVAAYNALGYTAATLGNHEFDFGPVGPAPSPVKPDDDPRGALKARAAQASFPFLAANVVGAKTHRPVTWPNVKPSMLITVAGVRIGIVGVVTAATGRAALPANVVGLEFLPLPETIGREAPRLRARGAKVVVAVAHEGGACQDFANPGSHASCDSESPIFSLALQLPSGSVDAIIAGHTHQAIAHRVGSVPVIQSYANGRAFGRIDLTLELKTGKVLASHIERPHEICPSGKIEACMPGEYEGAEVVADEKLVALNAPAFAEARKKGEELLGVGVLRPLPNRRGEESALGNLLADLMRQARPGSDVAVLNGGGMRAGLPSGPLTFGSLYETFPFDNVFASLRLPAGELRKVLGRNLGHASSLVSLSGVRVRARCKASGLDVTITRADGSPIADGEALTITTTDFLATGGDGFFAGASATLENGPPIREAMAEVLRKRGGPIDSDKLLDARAPRIDLPGPVPVRCEQ
jgi:5'-nucleotidase